MKANTALGLIAGGIGVRLALSSGARLRTTVLRWTCGAICFLLLAVEPPGITVV